MTKPKKPNLNLKLITGFLLENIDMISENVPYWLLEMNNGIADPEIFNNADEFEYEEIVDILESALSVYSGESCHPFRLKVYHFIL